MADSTGDKTLDPTPRRRQQARDAGRVAQSQELGSAVVLLGGLVALLIAGAAIGGFLLDYLRFGLGGGTWKACLDTDPGRVLATDQWNALMPSLARLLLPVLVGSALLAVAVQMMQTGFLIRPGRVLPEVKRLSPAAGIGRILSGESMARLGLAVVKLGILTAVAFGSLWSRREEIAKLAALDLHGLAAQAWHVCLDTCLKMAAALVVLALLDYAYQRWKLERDLRMTPQELREEMRELQGDPQLAARRRALQRATADGRSAHGSHTPASTSPRQIGPIDPVG